MSLKGRWSRSPTRVLAAATALWLTLMTSACTGSQPVPTPPAPPRTASFSPTDLAATFGAAPVNLSCKEGAAGLTSGYLQELQIGPVALRGFGVESPPNPAQDVGLKVPPNLRLLFKKAPLQLEQETKSVVMTVPADGRQFLAWVPVESWTSGSSPDLTAWATTALTITNCTDREIGFLGGLLGTDPDRCFPITVQPREGTATTAEITLSGKPCD